MSENRERGRVWGVSEGDAERQRGGREREKREEREREGDSLTE